MPIKQTYLCTFESSKKKIPHRKWRIVIGNNSLIQTIVPRYSFFGPKWKKSNLTFKFINYSLKGFSESEIKSAFKQAIEIWVQHAPNLSITESSTNDADINIGFFSGSHGKHRKCKNDFSSSNIYAHAFEPPIGFSKDSLNGQIHINSNVNFTLEENNNAAIDLITIFAHELGHALGIDHSGLLDALMKSACELPHRYLGDDDIYAIQRLFP